MAALGGAACSKGGLPPHTHAPSLAGGQPPPSRRRRGRRRGPSSEDDVAEANVKKTKKDVTAARDETIAAALRPTPRHGCYLVDIDDVDWGWAMYEVDVDDWWPCCVPPGHTAVEWMDRMGYLEMALAMPGSDPLGHGRATGDEDFDYYDAVPPLRAHAALQECAAMAEEHGADPEDVAMAQPGGAGGDASPCAQVAAFAVADLDEGAWPGLPEPASHQAVLQPALPRRQCGPRQQ